MVALSGYYLIYSSNVDFSFAVLVFIIICVNIQDLSISQILGSIKELRVFKCNTFLLKNQNAQNNHK